MDIFENNSYIYMFIYFYYFFFNYIFSEDLLCRQKHPLFFREVDNPVWGATPVRSI